MNFEFKSKLSETDINRVRDKLKQFNEPHIKLGLVEDFAFYASDDHGNTLAGIVCEIIGNWLKIKLLWVSEDYRGNGLGTELIQKAEDYSRAQGCSQAHVSTFEFQAKPFYESLGYQLVLTLPNSVPTLTDYQLTKTLSD